MKITTRGNGGVHTGAGKEILCNDIDVGGIISRAVITIDADEIVAAECNIYLKDVDIDDATLKINGIEAPEELVNALRNFFRSASFPDIEAINKSYIDDKPLFIGGEPIFVTGIDTVVLPNHLEQIAHFSNGSKLKYKSPKE